MTAIRILICPTPGCGVASFRLCVRIQRRRRTFGTGTIDIGCALQSERTLPYRRSLNLLAWRRMHLFGTTSVFITPQRLRGQLQPERPDRFWFRKATFADDPDR